MNWKHTATLVDHGAQESEPKKMEALAKPAVGANTANTAHPRR